MKCLVIIGLVIGLIGVTLGIVSFIRYRIMCMVYDRVQERMEREIKQLQTRVMKQSTDIALIDAKYRKYVVGIKIDGEEPPKFGDN